MAVEASLVTSGVTLSPSKKNKVIQRISEKSGLSQKLVSRVFALLVEVIEEELSEQGPGECRIPHTGIKLRRLIKPPTKARKMHSPLTGKIVCIPAKPARPLVKLIALKPLKDLVNKAF